MAVVMTVDFPATTDVYDQVNEALGVADNPPAGLIVHTASEIDSGMRIVDVWESEDAYSKFREERLLQAVSEVIGPEAAQGPPSHQVLEIHNMIKP